MKMLGLVVGLCALLAAAYYGLQGNRLPGASVGGEPTGPKQSLDNVRQKARGFEQDSQHQADEILGKGQ